MLKIKVDVLRAGRVTANGNIYPELVIRRALDRLEQEDKSLVVQRLHLDTLSTEIVGLSVDNQIQNGVWSTEVTIDSDIPNGCPEDSTLCLLPLGTGSTMKTPEGYRVMEDYQLNGLAVCYHPSARKLALRKYKQALQRNELK